MRTKKPSDFVIDLPGVGNFRFARRTFQDHVNIRADYAKHTQGTDTDNELSAYATLLSLYQNLCVSCPAGWEDLSSLEMTDDLISQSFMLLEQIRGMETSFREGEIKGSETPGQGISE